MEQQGTGPRPSAPPRRRVVGQTAIRDDHYEEVPVSENISLLQAPDPNLRLTAQAVRALERIAASLERLAAQGEKSR